MSRKTFVKESEPAKVLFLDSSRDSFAFHKNIADTLKSIPKLTLLYAQNANQALKVLESNQVDVVILDAALKAELKTICESIDSFNFPLLIRSAEKAESSADLTSFIKTPSSCCVIPKGENIASVHRTLLVANGLCNKNKKLSNNKH